MAKPILVANWKNHPGSLAEAKALLKGLSKEARLYKNLSLFIAPPAPYLELAALKARNFARLACQDMAAFSQGTYTAMLTPDILKSLGVRLAIIGHSERRALGETSAQVVDKVKVALRAGIVPLVCIGEQARDVDGEHFDILREELKSSLSGLNAKTARGIIIAYEPVWVIGKSAKDALPPAELAQTVIFLKKQLSDLYGRSVAESIPILYGGAVEPENAGALMRETYIKGFLVGHASLKPESFKSIAESLLTKI
ncbi:MAG: Triosephosphate isomerase [Parcubacteria group bacterium GW2011_GWA2_50_10b]|nr:MAG: Triosephosphate isomerase [Parcubacteria group bacterium GW2011_GWA2_50_10b]